MKPIFHRAALAMAALTACGAQAQTSTPKAPAAVALPPVTITGNPLGAVDLITPVLTLSGPRLVLQQGSTLGDTLDATPGVSSTWFGPNANRPVIRGLDGDRIRILTNGGASIDASGLSFDHAVPLDPISVERIEVLRGPAALLYGGSAVGGVVNVIDNRIPREPLEGIRGKVDAGYATGARATGMGFSVEGGTRQVGLHADVFSRSGDDVRVPADLVCNRGGVSTTARRICNSASDVRGGALGGTLFLDRGHLGASVSTYRNNYGAVAEDEVTIGMQSRRVALEGEWRPSLPGVQNVKAQWGHTNYRHTEFDAGAPGTVFRNKGQDFRLEARHDRWGPLEGVLGVQTESNRFSADGEEAFAPYSRTRQAALFVHEEWSLPWGRLSFGARTERVTVESMGNPQVDRFVAGGRSFSPRSLALGGLWNLAPKWQFTAHLARSERAPRDYELFANGPHVATAAWELGSATLDKERSQHLDVGVQWKSGPDQARIHLFQTRFDNYIALESTAVTQEDLPEFAYRQMGARFRGLEAQGNLRLHDAGPTLDLEWKADMVRAIQTANGQPLPRIAPVRLGATLVWTQGPWGARLGFDRFQAQARVPAGERATDGATLWSAALTRRMALPSGEVLWFARLQNATDRLAQSATSILTQTAPGKSPLPGRSLKIGMQASF